MWINLFSCFYFFYCIHSLIPFFVLNFIEIVFLNCISCCFCYTVSSIVCDMCMKAGHCNLVNKYNKDMYKHNFISSNDQFP